MVWVARGVKAHPVPSGMDTFHQPRLLQALTDVALEFWGLEPGSRHSTQREELPTSTFQSSLPPLNYILSHKTLL